MKKHEDLKPKKIIVKAVCPCGNRIRVKIFDNGEPLDVWEVACQNHHKLHMKVVLGNIHVSGEAPKPALAAGVVQRAIRDKAPVVRTTGHVEFVHKVKF